MVILLTVVCLCSMGYFYYGNHQTQILIDQYQQKVSRDFDIISKYLLKLPTIDHIHVYSEQQSESFEDLHAELERIKDEIILNFEKERVELQQQKENRSKDTFKSLKKAFATKTSEQDND